MKVLFSYLLMAFAINHTLLIKTQAFDESWQVIGTVHANFSTDHSSIIVHEPFNNFHRLKFKVTRAALRLVKLVVTYERGSPDNIETMYTIPIGGESHAIELRIIGDRKVKKIDFWYDGHGATDGEAEVTVLAIK